MNNTAMRVSLPRHGLTTYGCSVRCGAQSARNSSAEPSGRSPRDNTTKWRPSEVNVNESSQYIPAYHEYSEQRMTLQFAATAE